MIIPLNWLKDYIKINKPAEEIGKMFTSLGLMLDTPTDGEVLDLEHRMDRSDWLSIIGCARDLAAMERTELKLPDSHLAEGKKPQKNQIVNIEIKCPDLVYRFNTRVFRNIKVKESPKWLKERLEYYGMPSINNIVDITNFVMIEYGQPMHAQDLAKFEKQEIIIRKAKTGEKITTLLGDEIELDEDIFILTQNDKPIAIGGIVGGADTEIDSNTTDIILDAGNYNHTNIRKSSRKLKIQNETVQRFDKFLHPQLTEKALNRATKLILDLAGGDNYKNIDWYPKKHPLKEMTLRLGRIKLISGMDFEMEKVREIVTALEYKILKQDTESLKLEVPFFRTDVIVEDDIVSDILRISGYTNIPLQNIQTEPPEDITPKIYKFEEQCRDILVNLGLHEHITNPIIKRDGKNKRQVTLENSINSEMNALRTKMSQTLYPVLEHYKKHGTNEVGVFEVGLVYLKDGERYEDYKEERVLGVIYTTSDGYKILNDKVKEILSGFLYNIGIDNVKFIKEGNKALIYNNKTLLGELRLDSFSLYTEKLFEAEKKILRVKEELVHKTTEDISLTSSTNLPFGPIVFEIKTFDDHITSVEVLDTYLDNQNGKTVSIRLIFESPKSINTEKISRIKKRLIKRLEREFRVSIKK